MTDFSTRLPFLLFTLLLPVASSLSAQSSDTLPPEIHWSERSTGVAFDARLRELRQVAGAPEAFYTYFWEFGDGSFSFDERPVHSYPDTGQYMVQLFATNNYDDGKAPPTRPRKVQVSRLAASAPAASATGFFKSGGALQLKVNRMPRPGEDMVCIIGYQNNDLSSQPVSGSIALFYNEKAFKSESFALNELKNYHKERTTTFTELMASVNTPRLLPLYASAGIPQHGPQHSLQVDYASNSAAASLLQEKSILYDSVNTLHFDALQPGEQRYLFAILHTTPEMIKDTNATVTLSAVMIPDDPTAAVQTFDLPLQIVASHDPNRLRLKKRRLNYRFLGQHRPQDYTVQFQNTGKGPASTINIGIKIPPELDLSTLELTDQYPECIPCQEARSGQSCLETVVGTDSLHFIFRNIYLPGVRQEGVEDKDSTQGFVSYRLRLKEKPPKIPFWSQAGIIFDKNEPVYTNKMRTRFYPGISPAIIGGYMTGLGNKSNRPGSDFILGAALAPYSPYRFYFQVEAYLGVSGHSTSTTFTPLEKVRDTVVNNRDYLVAGHGRTTKRSSVTLDIVPLQIRRNLNSWLGVGSGVWLKGYLSEKNTVQPFSRLQFRDNEQIQQTDVFAESYTKKESFTHIDPGVFIDLNLGKVRVGPAVGLRLLHFFSANQTGLMCYALWRL